MATIARYTLPVAYYDDEVQHADLKPYAALHILISNAHNTRYVDELSTIANDYSKHLMYTSDIWKGFKGIYPDTLTLEPSRAGIESPPFRDFRAHATPGLGPVPTSVTANQVPTEDSYVAHVHTTLYDKRRNPEFQEVNKISPIIRMLHITSGLSARCKCKIIAGKFIHFSRIISIAEDFAEQLALYFVELVAKHYLTTRLYGKILHMFNTHRKLYNGYSQAILMFLFLCNVIKIAQNQGMKGWPALSCCNIT